MTSTITKPKQTTSPPKNQTSPPEKSTGFLRYMHNFRGLVILMIVASHSIDPFDGGTGSAVQAGLLTFLKNGSTFFVFIAGFLFQFLSRKFDYGSYLGKKFWNVLLPYCLISIPTVALCILKGRPESQVWFREVFANWALPQQIMGLLVTGSHFYPLWFIPMIALFYLVAPLFIAIDRVPKRYWLLVFLLPLSVLVARPVSNHIPQLFIHFLPVYVLGMFASHYRDRIFAKLKYFLPILLSASALMVVVEMAMRSQPTFDINAHIPFSTINKEIFCLLLMYGLWRLDARLPNQLHKALSGLANFSFGIYFLHGYVLMVYEELLPRLPASLEGWLTQGNLVAFILLVGANTAICCAVLAIAGKLLGKNRRYFLGC